MLKIGSVKWRGKCSKHTMFDPYSDGAGAVRGNCDRCNALLEIHDCHQRMLRLMRTFSPPAVRKKAATPFDDLQESLF
jgi:hypothetical protein